jgi:hypothetical protein
MKGGRIPLFRGESYNPEMGKLIQEHKSRKEYDMKNNLKKSDDIVLSKTTAGDSIVIRKRDLDVEMWRFFEQCKRISKRNELDVIRASLWYYKDILEKKTFPTRISNKLLNAIRNGDVDVCFKD